jgi:hypothetical protein
MTSSTPNIESPALAPLPNELLEHLRTARTVSVFTGDWDEDSAIEKALADYQLDPSRHCEVKARLAQEQADDTDGLVETDYDLDAEEEAYEAYLAEPTKAAARSRGATKAAARSAGEGQAHRSSG